MERLCLGRFVIYTDLEVETSLERGARDVVVGIAEIDHIVRAARTGSKFDVERVSILHARVQ